MVRLRRFAVAIASLTVVCVACKKPTRVAALDRRSPQLGARITVPEGYAVAYRIEDDGVAVARVVVTPPENVKVLRTTEEKEFVLVGVARGESAVDVLTDDDDTVHFAVTVSEPLTEIPAPPP